MTTKKKSVVKAKAGLEKRMPKLSLAKKIFTKSDIQKTISSHVGITKNQVNEVFNLLAEIIRCHLTKGAVGVIKLEGLLKIEKIHKPAKKARKGINPFTGEEVMFKAKPAHHVIKIRALKKLKEMA